MAALTDPGDATNNSDKVVIEQASRKLVPINIGGIQGLYLSVMEQEGEGRGRGAPPNAMSAAYSGAPVTTASMPKGFVECPTCVFAPEVECVKFRGWGCRRVQPGEVNQLQRSHRSLTGCLSSDPATSSSMSLTRLPSFSAAFAEGFRVKLQQRLHWA